MQTTMKKKQKKKQKMKKQKKCRRRRSFIFLKKQEAINAWFCSESESGCAIEVVCYCAMQIESRCLPKNGKQILCEVFMQTNSYSKSERIPVMCVVL